jgi:hypothetical protein
MSNTAANPASGEKENMSVLQIGGPLAAGLRAPAKTDTATQTGRTWSANMWREWDMKGRATFRPASNEQGRPVYHPDAEEAELQLRQLKKEVRQANEERDLVKAQLVMKDKEIKRRDHHIFKELEDSMSSSALPGRLVRLMKECLVSGQTEEVRMLREKVAALEAAAEVSRVSFLVPGASIADATSIAPSTPVASKLSGRFDEDAAPSPVRRHKSFSGGSSRNLTGGGGGGEALQAARAEIERLNKLNAAHEVIREGLEKRVSQLEAQLQRNTLPADGTAGVAASSLGADGARAGAGDKDGKGNWESLYTVDGSGFDNYIRRLAGLAELPSSAAGTDAQVAVRVGTDVKSKRRPAVQVQGAGGDSEAVYEVTCYTSDLEGAGTSSNCYITLRGGGGEFGPCLLDRSDAHPATPGVGVLSRNATDVFDIVAPNVEPLHSIIMSLDMAGSSPSWHVRTVTLRRARTGKSEPKSYRFEWNNWVGPPQGTPVSSSDPVSVTLFPETAHNVVGAPGGRVRVSAEGAGKKQQHTGAAHPGGAGSAGQRMVINKTALSTACESIVSAVKELHRPTSVCTQGGLELFARLCGQAGGALHATSTESIQIPSSCRNLNVMIVGPRQLCSELVEWYGGCVMPDTGLGTKARFTLIKSLARGGDGKAQYAVGEDGKGRLGRVAKVGEAVQGLMGSMAVAEVACSQGRMAQVDFIHPPVIEGNPPQGGPSSVVQQTLNEVREVLQNQVESLKAIFTSIDQDGNGNIDVDEWKEALKKLGLDMPAPRAERLFKALDVSGDGEIEYGEFLAVFKPALTKYPYDLEAAMKAVAAQVDLIIFLVDPKSIHYNARELALIQSLYTAHAAKLRIAFYARESLQKDGKLCSHILPAARHRLEEVMGLASNTLLGHMPVIWAPSSNSSKADAGAVVDNQIDQVLVWVLEALLALENLAADQTDHNIRVLLDGLWSCKDIDMQAAARARLTEWLQAWRDASARRKTPSFKRLHTVLDTALKDVKRGHVVAEDVESWTPKRVAQWLVDCNPKFEPYKNNFEDDQVTGKRLLRVTEDMLKKKYHVTSLGHRKEMLRHLDALIRGRKAWLKH